MKRLTEEQIINLMDLGIAERIYSKKDPDQLYYSVAGKIYIWLGQDWGETDQKYNLDEHI